VKFNILLSMKRLVLALVALMTVAGASAQDIRYGIVGGLNLAWQKEKTDRSNMCSDSYIAFHAGIRATSAIVPK
jgi:hypothetical protein